MIERLEQLEVEWDNG